ncbi:hypothetical protein FBUS_00196 [Fasciolopsis buskii]|uniref:Uncharacterized protein n=1 Tax=Fasciolopsis buskii TaxID=27845 RepID=A0A8E0S4H5_9TREM|nr:hypothetical protein FBUS_00196 [Fasciolopsis buski]
MTDQYYTKTNDEKDPNAVLVLLATQSCNRRGISPEASYKTVADRNNDVLMACTVYPLSMHPPSGSSSSIHGLIYWKHSGYQHWMDGVPNPQTGSKLDHVQKNSISLKPITFRNADAYLIVPALRLYEHFTLRFSVKTVQSNGLILFNPGSFAVDFIAFEISQGQIFVNFDMGSGVQRHGLLGVRVDDNRWHTVELIRTDMEKNILTLRVDFGMRKKHSAIDIKVTHGERSKNFNFAEKLYVGGVPKSVILKWREKLPIIHGFQGCLANLSVNNQPSRDLLNEAAQTSHNQTNPNYVSMEDVVSGCLDRPTGAPRCPLQTSGQLLGGPELDGVSARFVNNAYCLNDGICLLMWSTLKCSCELTSFQGSRCSKTAATQRFGVRVPLHESTSQSSSITKNSDSNGRIESIGYLRLSYTDSVRNTHQEEFVMGIQTTKKMSTIHNSFEETKLHVIQTLMLVTNSAQTGDYLHLYLRYESEYIRARLVLALSTLRLVTYLSAKSVSKSTYSGFKCSSTSVPEQARVKLCHIQLFIRLSSCLFSKKMKINPGHRGKQFNGQEVIWLGHAPSLNRTDFFQGYMSGVYYNGLLLSEISAGLTYLPFIHVTKYANVEYVENFEASISSMSPFGSPKKRSDTTSVNYQNHSMDLTGQHNYDGISNTQADAESIHPNHLETLVRTRGNYLPSQKSDHYQSYDVSLTRSEVQGSIHDQVNIWLLVCLSGAGFVMLASLTFLAYRFHFRQFLCCRPSRRIRRQQKQNLTKLSERNNEDLTDIGAQQTIGIPNSLRCSPVLISSSCSSVPITSVTQLDGSATEIYNSALALMLSKAVLSDPGDKSGHQCSPSCLPIHLSDKPPSVVYLDRNSLISATAPTLYHPFASFPFSTVEQTSSVSPYSTSSSPVVDLIKPTLNVHCTPVKPTNDVELHDLCKTGHKDSNQAVFDAPQF